MTRHTLRNSILLAVLLYAFTTFLSAQSLTTLYSFAGSDGANPDARLVQGNDGNFYGNTWGGGPSGNGTIFKITPSGTLTTLYSFAFFDGEHPAAGLTQGRDGNFYGTTESGGADDAGAVFQITPSGTLTTLYSFTGGDGEFPYAGLVQGSDGNFYGTTVFGGADCLDLGCGTVFQITPSGTLTTLYIFAGSDGANPYAGLVQGSDGNFYGTTKLGGLGPCTGGCGTVFKITPSGTLTTLYGFAGSDGEFPYAGLVQGSDGNFYGTTYGGGANSDGTVFKITPGGTLTTLYSFASSDGASPIAGLVQGSDGNFYGTTAGGGANSDGTVFKITPSGALTTLYSFAGNGGANPDAGLVQGSDGNFYGTTAGGGANNKGTVFRLSQPLQFVAVTPCRLVDTRSSNPISGGTFQTFNLPQLAQANGCAALNAAGAYSLNVTLVPIDHQHVSYLTIWPADGTRPVVSTMNSLDGRVKANAAIVPAGASGAVSVYVTNTTNVVLDIDGYFAPATQSTLAFYSLPPCRVADTRSIHFPQGLGAPQLSAGVARDFPMLSSTCIPTNVTPAAYSLNFTAVPYPQQGDPLGYLELWPTGQQPPNPVSTLNNPTGTNVANAAIVPAGTHGEITAYANDDTNLLIDINGYFAAPGQGGLSLYPLAPCRVFDSRGVGGGQPFSGLLNPPVNFPNSGCGVPTAALGYVANATVIPSPTLAYLTLWPDGQNQPVVSTLNAPDGWITSNMAIVPTSNGSIDAYAAGLTQLILDISSYFAP